MPVRSPPETVTSEASSEVKSTGQPKRIQSLNPGGSEVRMLGAVLRPALY